MEQFSICSGDSIWEDEERRNEYIESKMAANRNAEDSPQPMYFNGFVRIDPNAYINPTYKNADGNFVQDEHVCKPSANAKSDDINYLNEQSYQVDSRWTAVK